MPTFFIDDAMNRTMLLSPSQLKRWLVIAHQEYHQLITHSKFSLQKIKQMAMIKADQGVFSGT